MTDFLGSIEDLIKQEWNKLTGHEPAPTPVVIIPSAPVEVIIPAPAIAKPTVLLHNIWPTQAQCHEYYGSPEQATWLKENTVNVTCPWTLHMDKVVLNHILIHKKVADSLTRVLNYIWEQTGKNQAEIEKLHYDKYSGSYNFRPIRGSSLGTLSMHAYAVAIDWDADENQQHSEKHLFNDESLLVKAFKSEGWVWGGDWSPSSIDAMHVQAARVR